jgi:ubiquinone/menaquinone biosynthesis C-methylase UbiE
MMAELTVREQYNQLAEQYDRRWRNYVTKTLSFLKVWAAIAPEETVLDVACGTGEFERLILSEQPNQLMIGVDISENMLAIARQKLQPYASVSFQVASAVSLPFSDQQFDVIISANSFHYFDQPAIALAEMHRVLKPNGRLIILDWCRDYLVCRICDAILKFFDPAHRQCYTQSEFHQLLLSAGFRIERRDRYRFDLIWGLMVAESMIR